MTIIIKNRENTSMTVCSSTRDSESVLSSASGFRCTVKICVSSFGSIWKNKVETELEFYHVFKMLTSSGSVAVISKIDMGSNGVQKRIRNEEVARWFSYYYYYDLSNLNNYCYEY